MFRIVILLLAACWATPAWASLILSDMVARFEFEALSDGGTAVHLLAGGPFGGGGIAAGFSDLTSIGYPPDPFRWLASEGEVSGIEPTPFAPDGFQVLSFNFDRTGNFSGIQPQPFRVFMSTPTMILGELDFSGVSGAMLGSLTGVIGLTLLTAPGVNVAIEPFDIRAVPEPDTLALFIAGLLGLGVVSCGRKVKRRLLS